MWDELGLVSFMLIGFWCGGMRSSIKALIYNQLGDLMWLLVVVLFVGMVSFSEYVYLSFELFSLV